jgi:hypothetical protein
MDMQQMMQQLLAEMKASAKANQEDLLPEISSE